MKFELEKFNENIYLYLEDRFRSEFFRMALQRAETFSNLVNCVGFSRTRVKEARKGERFRRGKLESSFMSAKLVKEIAKLVGASFTEIEKHVIYVKRGDSGKPVPIILPIKPSLELAALIGHVTGDGHITEKKKKFEYSNSNPILISKVSNLVNKAIGRVQPTVSLLFRLNKKIKLSFPVSCLEVALTFSLDPREFFGDYHEIKKVDLYIKLRFPSIVAHILEFFGSPTGRKTRKNFDVPDWIKSSSFNLKKEYIKALFDDEGHVKKQILLQMNKTKKLRKSGTQFLNSVKNILKGMEIDCRGVYESRAKREDSIKMVLGITDQISQKIFLKKIGFTHPEKIRNLKDLVFAKHGKPRKPSKTKCAILQSLTKRPKLIKQLSSEIGISVPTIRDHLYDLEQSGLVKRVRKRTNFHYEGDLWFLANEKTKNYTQKNLVNVKPHVHKKVI